MEPETKTKIKTKLPPRNAALTVRMRAEDYAALQECAHKSRMGLSEWARNVLLKEISDAKG